MSDASRLLLRRTAAADPAGARELRLALQGLLERLGVEAATRDALLLAVAELVVNPGRHAQPPASSVELRFARAANRWVLELADDGGPFVDFATAWAEGPSDPLDESGRGLALVAAQLPDVAYHPGDAGAGGRNRLVLRAPCAPAAPATVLLVDDDAPTLRLLTLYLQPHYRVVACASVAAALAELAARPVDLVVSDIRMPEASGIELRRRLTENAGTDTLPFVFLSGLPEAEARADGLAVDDYLVKPVAAAHLRAVVARVLARSRQLRSRLGERLDAAITARLRPALPERIGPFRAAVRTRAAGAGGGDLLFCRPCQQGHLLVLADLMGHGTGAKFFAHALAGYLHGLVAASAEVGAPGVVLERVSAAFADDPLLGETLVTLLALRLGDTGTLELAAAAHPCPWLATADGVSRLAVEGPLPGLGAAGDYPVMALQLRGRLLLCTDGVLERGGDAAAEEALGQALGQALAATAGLPLEAAADALWEAVGCAGGAPEAADDATLVLLERG